LEIGSGKVVRKGKEERRQRIDLMELLMLETGSRSA
jgi:hypothetical protein